MLKFWPLSSTGARSWPMQILISQNLKIPLYHSSSSTKPEMDTLFFFLEVHQICTILIKTVLVWYRSGGHSYFPWQKEKAFQKDLSWSCLDPNIKEKMLPPNEGAKCFVKCVSFSHLHKIGNVVAVFCMQHGEGLRWRTLINSVSSDSKIHRLKMFPLIRPICQCYYKWNSLCEESA